MSQQVGMRLKRGGASSGHTVAETLLYARKQRSRSVSELAEFVRFPSISAQPHHAKDVERCARWLADHLRSVGLSQVKLTRTPGHPIVYAEWTHEPGLPTVLIYGHYDVQPADPLDAWRTPPFEPTIRGDDLFARGASDDKGQLFVHIKAIESFLKTTGRLPINVKCVFEGEEEIGSPNLLRLLRLHPELFGADAVVVSDTRILGPDHPAITYALRGALSLELEVRGPTHDLHSGAFGGATHNPVQALCEILAGLHDEEGRITIPGFYDSVRPVSDAERAYMKRVGHSDRQILRDTGAPAAWGESGYTLYERTTIRPALSVTGISGGYAGSGHKSIIPDRASAKLNFRLVPGQQPREIERLFRRHVARICPPTVRTIVRGSKLAADPVVVNRNHLAMKAATTAYRRAFGRVPVFLRSGGTIPIVSAFCKTLKVPVVLMGFALPNDRMHAPNEKLHLPTFARGVQASILLMELLGNARKSFIGTQSKQSVVHDPHFQQAAFAEWNV